jgi:glycosyltransferase involved in cell wall biosynthesis
MFSLGLIINTFDQPDYLARVLAGVVRQTSAPEEVLIADDGSGEPTRKLVAEWAGPLRAKHIWQQHDGFRRARILNQAIARAQSEYLVFLDGDTIPHPKFIADHRCLAQAGGFIQGHRALVGQRAAAWFGLGDFKLERQRVLWQGQIAGVKHAFRWPFAMVRRRQDLRGVRGCNLAIWRADLVSVNGYNEEFVGWGREDSELAVRLMNLGRQRLDARGRALTFHLWHPPASRANLLANDELLADARDAATTRCKIGLAQWLDEKSEP